MFRAFSRPSLKAQWLQWQPLVLPSYCGDSRAVFVVGPAGRPARPRTQNGYHHDTKVKPEAATAVTELLMTGGRTPETCWAVNKRQDNKLENCCIWLLIYSNCTMMYKLTNLKFKSYRDWFSRHFSLLSGEWRSSCAAKNPECQIYMIPSIHIYSDYL
jgi:hypothetical protein